jgi:predicted kinase
VPAEPEQSTDDRAVTVVVLTMTRGLPGAGKSTWAEARVLERPAGEVVRLTKDSLRAMLHAGRWQGDRTERQVLAARDGLVHVFLGRGVDVIVDDTNLHPRHERRLRQLAQEHEAAFVVQDFTHVPLPTCIERDRQRPRSVGAGVIRTMHRQFLAEPVEPVGPVGPVEPVAPVKPTEPAVLTEAAEPVGPMEPAMPYDGHPPAPS